jgi:hypothetical protein
MNKTDHKNPGVKPGVHQGQGVPASYMTPAMLLVYTVKSGKSLCSNRGSAVLLVYTVKSSKSFGSNRGSAVLLVYTVKSGKSLGSDNGQKTST